MRIRTFGGCRPTSRVTRDCHGVHHSSSVPFIHSTAQTKSEPVRYDHDVVREQTVLFTDFPHGYVIISVTGSNSERKCPADVDETTGEGDAQVNQFGTLRIVCRVSRVAKSMICTAAMPTRTIAQSHSHGLVWVGHQHLYQRS